MSTTTDDYGPTHGRTNNTEPADPPSVNHETRRKQPLAPPSVKEDRLPYPLTDRGLSLSVDEARVAYLRTQRASWTADDRTSKYERHRYLLYPRILDADRHFQNTFEGLTTAMLTRRLSPLGESGNWLTPWECDEMLHGGSIHRSVREALDYHLAEFTYEWIAVTAPTRSAGTPHEHIYLWIDDPEDEVEADLLSPALDKHLKYCGNAYQKHHRYRTDGTGGAITVEHTPRVVEEPPEELSSILESSTPHPNTAGAQYLASQLAHLPLGDFYAGDRDNPPKALFEGAALAWASPRNWFRASQGVPAL